jgi:hypothetical protein
VDVQVQPMTVDILRTIDISKVLELRRLGAVVTDTHMTATEEILWEASIIGKQRDLLEERKQLSVSRDAESTLLLHFDGTQNSTNFVDSSRNSYANVGIQIYDDGPPLGQVYLDVGQAKFGSASLKFIGRDATVGYQSVGDIQGWPFPVVAPFYSFGTADFTIDTWLRYSAPALGDNGYDGSFGLWQTYNATGSSVNTPSLQVDANRILSFISTFDPYTQAIISPVPIPIDAWAHIALTRAAAQTRMFINGAQVGPTYADSRDYTLSSFILCQYFGGSFAGGGFLDEFRIVNGTAVWVSSFDPPTRSYLK